VNVLALRRLPPLHGYYTFIRPCLWRRYLLACIFVLAIFSWHPQTGSPVPLKSLYHGPATYAPAAIRSVDSFLPD